MYDVTVVPYLADCSCPSVLLSTSFSLKLPFFILVRQGTLLTVSRCLRLAFMRLPDGPLASRFQKQLDDIVSAQAEDDKIAKRVNWFGYLSGGFETTPKKQTDALLYFLQKKIKFLQKNMSWA